MVTFIGTIDHGLKHGYYSKEYGFSVKKGWWDDCMVVLKGRKEYVVECDDSDLIDELKALPNDSYMFQKMKVVTKFLDDKNINWEIFGKAAEL